MSIQCWAGSQNSDRQKFGRASLFRDPRDTCNSCNTPLGRAHWGGQQRAPWRRKPGRSCRSRPSDPPASMRYLPVPRPCSTTVRPAPRNPPPRPASPRLPHASHQPTACPSETQFSHWFAIRLFSLTSEIIPRSTHPTRSALLPDGRDMHPEPEELHGRVHRQQRRGSTPPRARRVVGVAGEASRRRAPSTSRGWTKQRGRFHDAISDAAAAAARERPSGVLRTVLRPPRDDRDGAVPGHAQRPRAPEPQGTSLAAARRLRASRISADDVIRRRLHGQRQDVLVVITGCIQRAVPDVRLLPPERPDEHGERVRDGGGVTTGW